MKKILFLFVLSAVPAFANGPLFRHKDAYLQQEFENAYQDMHQTAGIVNNGRFVNPLDYGAKGDGITDDTAAIQAAHDAIVASGKSGTLLLPGKTFKCNSGLTINTSFVNVLGQAARLDFTSLTSGTTAMTFIGDTNNGYSGNPYYNADKYISNVTLIGPGRATATTGFWFRTAAEPGPSHFKAYNCNLSAWGKGMVMGDNSYLLGFYGCEVWISSICVYIPAGTNSGERIYFSGGAFFNSETGFLVENANSDLYIDGTSIDGMDVNYITALAGDINVSKTHFEGSYCPGACRTHVFYVPTNATSNVVAHFTDSLILLKSSRTVGAFELNKTTYLNVNNTHINSDGSVSQAIIISSQGTGSYVDTSGIVNTTNDSLFQDNTGNTQYFRNEVGVGLLVNKFGTFVTSVTANGQFQFQDGKQSAPGAGFFSETNTGFMRVATGQPAMTVQGSTAVVYGPFGASDDNVYRLYKFFSGGGSGNYTTSSTYSTASVTTSTKTIFGDGLGDGGMLIVYGSDGGTNKFVDLLLSTYDNSTPVTVSQKNLNSPAARTYSMNANGTVRLMMASGTYNIRACGIGMGAR